ncbi:hypothetical protein FUA26_08880 [Seonamhaeicola algicola]|uniref:Uncharacterized protein n=1 Tax=Seonamhaeicola algicola TaxID=1719036 RepID=A0A5C7APS3_9FLAO|nr:hypothetical protein [Seonamhaeicola algicola]TXE09593.1 hypothetical protein FUA26_08880 [Seonamhaeicola algicola]
MKESFINLKEVALKNNCPECYNNDGLRLTFTQKFVETRFYKSITNQIDHVLECKVCKTTIYPVQWTDDIDRVFEYQQKAIKPKKASKYFKKTFWAVILLCVLLIVTTLVLLIKPNIINVF